MKWLSTWREHKKDKIVDKYGDRPEDEPLPGRVLALWCVLVPSTLSTLWEVLSDSGFWRKVWADIRRDAWPWQ